MWYLACCFHIYLNSWTWCVLADWSRATTQKKANKLTVTSNWTIHHYNQVREKKAVVSAKPIFLLDLQQSLNNIIEINLHIRFVCLYIIHFSQYISFRLKSLDILFGVMRAPIAHICNTELRLNARIHTHLNTLYYANA